MNPLRPHAGLDELKADFPFGIAVSSASRPSVAAGVATCAVRRSVDPGTCYLMSCRHVLSMSLIDEASTFTDMTVSIVGAELQRAGQPTSVRGGLAGQSGDFDAQLARLDTPAQADRALHGLSFGRSPPMLQGPADMAGVTGFWIATGRRAADGGRRFVWVADPTPEFDFTMEYTLGHGVVRQITHTRVFRGRAEDTLGPGDSGSPAVLTQSGGRLIGMYIGGDGVNAYVIPSWQLLYPPNFGVRTGETWTLA